MQNYRSNKLKKTNNSDDFSKSLIVSIIFGAAAVLLAFGHYIYCYVLKLQAFLENHSSFSDVSTYIFFNAGPEYADSIIHKIAIALVLAAFVALNIIFLVKASNAFRLMWLVARIIEAAAAFAQYNFCEKQYLTFPNPKVIIAAAVIILMEIAILVIYHEVAGCLGVDAALWGTLLAINILNVIYYLIAFAIFALFCLVMWQVLSFLFDIPEPEYKAVDVFNSAGEFVGKMMVRL